MDKFAVNLFHQIGICNIDRIFVAGCIGPLGKKVRPFGSVPLEDAYEYFKEQAEGLFRGGIDLFVLETFTYINELEQAVLAVKSICDLPILTLATVTEEASTLIGMEPAGFIPIMESWNVDAVGVNCSVGPHALLTAVEEIVKIAQLPVIVEPNAGIPRNVEGRNIYLCSPEYMAEYARRYIELGVKIIGGCCGTRGEHIKAIRNASKMIHPGSRTSKIDVRIKEAPQVEKIPPAQKSRFAKRLLSGEFVTSVELTPPKGWETDSLIEKAAILHANGIDCINIPDGPRASARMSPQVLSYLIQRDVGIETILHYCCRDRNLLGMQSDILGNYAAGQRNILVITGDPPKLGDYPDATAVFDIDSIGLTRMIHHLNSGVDLGNKPIGRPTGYFIGVGANPNAIDLEREISRFFQKAGSGAEFAITQPVFDVESLLSFMDKVKDTGIPFLAGIWPLVSFRNAEFMKHEVPGVYVPDEILERMNRFESKEDQLKEGIQIGRELLEQVKEHVRGIQVSAPFGHVEYALRILQGIVPDNHASTT
ncbi:bifunctional homocysteine S-methyltransferase/methylenetetrahydrofolate reductase [candidate division KSB1 bacterium]